MIGADLGGCEYAPRVEPAALLRVFRGRSSEGPRPNFGLGKAHDRGERADGDNQETTGADGQGQGLTFDKIFKANGVGLRGDLRHDKISRG
jgi:hypothetical protein